MDSLLDLANRGAEGIGIGHRELVRIKGRQVAGQEAPGGYARIDVFVAFGLVDVDPTKNMATIEFLASAQAGRGEDVGHALDGLPMIASDALYFVGHHQTSCQPPVLRGDAGRAGILVALQRLDTAQCQHHAAGASGQIGAEGQAFDQMKAGKNLAAGNDFDFSTQIEAVETIADENQGIRQRHADRIGIFQRRRAGSALAAINGDEIGPDSGFQHGLAQREELAALADAQFEADWLSAGQ